MTDVPAQLQTEEEIANPPLLSLFVLSFTGRKMPTHTQEVGLLSKSTDVSANHQKPPHRHT